MKVKSNVYANRTIRFEDQNIVFTGNSADVSDDVWAKLKNSGLPVFNSLPEDKSKTEKDFDSDVQALNKGYQAELSTLHTRIENLKDQLKSSKTETENWKSLYEKDVADLNKRLEAALRGIVLEEIPSTEEDKKSEGEDGSDEGNKGLEEEIEVMRKELSEKTVAELKAYAVDPEIGLSEDSLKYLKKDEIVDAILKKMIQA